MIHKDGLAPLEAFITEVADVRGFACKTTETEKNDETRVKTVTKSNGSLNTVFLKKETVRKSNGNLKTVFLKISLSLRTQCSSFRCFL